MALAPGNLGLLAEEYPLASMAVVAASCALAAWDASRKGEPRRATTLVLVGIFTLCALPLDVLPMGAGVERALKVGAFAAGALLIRRYAKGRAG